MRLTHVFACHNIANDRAPNHHLLNKLNSSAPSVPLFVSLCVISLQTNYNHKNALLPLASDALTSPESSASPPLIVCHRAHIVNTASSEESTSSPPPPKTATILRNKKPTPTHSGGSNATNNNNKKHTRFQLAQHRKSLSESDLLHEIDDALVFSRGFLLARGRFCSFCCSFVRKAANAASIACKKQQIINKLNIFSGM